MAENLAYESEEYEIYTIDGMFFYTWAAAMDSAGVYSTNGKGCGYDVTCSPILPVRGICPEGWHLPDTTEWNALYKTVGKKAPAMQSLGFAEWQYATNDFGFSAIPAGHYINGDFKCIL